MDALSPNTRFDLHLHTSASDGRYPLDEVLKRCARGGLQVIAITDHDLGVQLEPGLIEIDGHTLQILPGAEISGVHDGMEYHLLCYFPHGIPAAFHDFCKTQCAGRTVRYDAALETLGLTGRPEHALALTRLHLAHALVDAGVVASRSEAFQKYLGNQHGLVPHMELPFTEAIRIAVAHGAITSWAHPPRVAVQRHLGTFAEAGLHGLEALRPHLNSSERKYLRKQARAFGMFLTGGSDWHGWTSPAPGLFQVTAREIGDFVDVLLAA